MTWTLLAEAARSVFNMFLITSTDVIYFLSRSFTVGTQEFSVLSLIFGPGLLVYLGYIIVSKIIDILP